MIEIRKEYPEDIAEIRKINDRAFGQSQEGVIVEKLRQSCEGLLSLVALCDEKIVGHILFSPVVIEGNGRTVLGMGLAPMAVFPEYQGQGIGARLIQAGLAMLKAQGCSFVIVLGDCEYYQRFGFKTASRYDIQCQWEVPDEAFMILVLDASKIPCEPCIAWYRSEFGDAM